MTHQEKLEKWNGILARFAAAGISRAEFCEAEGISISELGYHLGKARRQAVVARRDGNPAFVELLTRPRDSASGFDMELSWPTGVALRATASYPPTSVVRIARSLSRKG